MWKDPIVEEVRALRDQYAQQSNYDLQAIQRDLKARAQASGKKLVTLPPRRVLRTQQPNESSPASA